MNLFKNLRFFLYLQRVSIRSSISVRSAFILESLLMLANNLIFLSIWWIFFRQFKEVSGWTINDIIALNAIGMGAFGFTNICFGGLKQLSTTIINGDIDPFMTQPKNLLIHLIGSKSRSRGWGLLMTTTILMILGGLTSPSEIAIILIGAICGCLVFTSMGVIVHSLVFWLGSIGSVPRKYSDALYLFAVYPTNIYSGWLQLIMFTIIPAGVIGYIPVELLRNFFWTDLFVLLGSALVFCWLAFTIFYCGLKRYESGNHFGMRL